MYCVDPSKHFCLRFAVFLLWAFCTFGNLNGQTCCSGGVPVSSNLGFQSASAKTLQVGLSFDFNFLRTLYDGSTTLDDALRERSTQSYLLRAAYNFDARLSAEVFFSLVRQTRKIYTNSGATDFESSFGLGDPVILLTYDVLEEPFKFRFGAGPQIPLGSHTERNDQGLLLVEDLQPGSGAWDGILFASIEGVFPARPSLLTYANALYSLNGKNDDSRGGLQSYQFGNDLQLILGFSDQFLLLQRIITPGLSIRYRHARRDAIDDIDSNGTGGEWLFMRTSAGVEMPWQSSLTVNFEFPIYTSVNETQLSPDFILNISWYKRFHLEVLEPIDLSSNDRP